MKAALDRITLAVAVAALVIALLAFLVGGTPTLIGAIAGGVLAVANGRAIAWVASGVISGTQKKRMALLATLGLKTAALAACVWLLAKVFHLDAFGLCMGLGALVIGLLVASLGIARAAAQES